MVNKKRKSQQKQKQKQIINIILNNGKRIQNKKMTNPNQKIYRKPIIDTYPIWQQ